MIFASTPLRVSLIGGGTDREQVYSRLGGLIYSLTIDKFCFATANKITDLFDFSIVDSNNPLCVVTRRCVNNIVHDIAKDPIRVGFGCTLPLYSTGLGVSSSVLVAATSCILGFGDTEDVPLGFSAERAYKEENKYTGCGKQDHYAAYFGGFRRYSIQTDGTVIPGRPITFPQLTDQMFLMFTGMESHKSSVIMKSIDKSVDIFDNILKLADRFHTSIIDRDVESCKTLIDESWEIKKSTSELVSNDSIDSKIEDLRGIGCRGLKVCGSGGGGFILGFHENPSTVKRTFSEERFLDFNLYPYGLKIQNI